MDTFGIQLLVGIALSILIVFPGTVSPAIKAGTDTIIGRVVAVLVILLLIKLGGWPLGILGAIAVLILMPTSMREGFMAAKGGFTGKRAEGFVADRIQMIPKERRQRWFIENALHESPQAIETDTVQSQSIN